MNRAIEKWAKLVIAYSMGGGGGGGGRKIVPVGPNPLMHGKPD